ncbi:hypothetical protein TI03_00590 [Achromatium sp. WMS1]|nr:hypothetical protein TI03_00590 [Achromatium sp. WMS1]
MRYTHYFVIIVFSSHLYANGSLLIPRPPQPEQEEELPVIKLSPRSRIKPLSSTPRRVIPVHLVQPFLTRTMVLQEDELAIAPRVVGFVEERFIGSSGDEIYASDTNYFPNQGPLEEAINLAKQARMAQNTEITDQMQLKFEVVRPGKPYIDPDSGENLGYEVIHLGTARLVQAGDPARLILTANSSDVRLHDRLFAVTENESLEDFVPIPAPSTLKGKILRMPGSNAKEIGGNDVVAINLGSMNRVKPGHVLHVVRPSVIPRSSTRYNLPTTLPKRVIGSVMIFRIFKHISYALVLKFRTTLHPNDEVQGSGM